jgi:hypothetical protein
MHNVSVNLVGTGAVSRIPLAHPLSAVMREGAQHDWAGLARIRMIREDLLEVDTPQEGTLGLMALLTGLQTGLLYAAASGLRIGEGAPDRGLAELATLCGTVGLVGPDGRAETLTLWNPSVTLKQVLGAAAAVDLTHFVLVRGPSRALPRMSVLVRSRDADMALERITQIRSLRADPPLLGTDPEEEEALLARNAQLVEASRSRRRRPPNRRALRPRLGAPETGWELPILPILARGTALPPPAIELDRMAAELCDALRFPTPPGLARKRVLTVLNRAWRLGGDPEQAHEGFTRYPKPGVLDFFRDRARAVEALTRDEASGQALRALTRISALQAWRYGAVHPRRSPQPPAPRFREERSVTARSVTPDAIDALLAYHVSGAPPDERSRKPLLEAGLIRNGEGPALTESGTRVVGELTSSPNEALPSLIDLLEPTPEAIRALDPDRPESPDPEPALLGQLIERAGTIAATRVRDDTDPMPELLSDLLGRAWRAGRDGRMRLPEGKHVRLPGPIRPFLEGRAELIASVTLPGRKRGKSSKALRLIRDSALEAWRIGSGPDPDTAPPPRYLEERPAPLRGLSSSAREIVRALGLGQEVEIGKRTQSELRRAGLLSGEAPAGLTPQGEAAARADRDHRSSGLPSISGAPSRRRSRPE